MQQFLYILRGFDLLNFCLRFCYVSVSFGSLRIGSNGFPFRLLAYIIEAFGVFIAFVTLRRTVHKHCTGFYHASIDLL